MADLDDFFAKKDKKKNKSARSGVSGGRFSTAEQVAKKLENQDGLPPSRPRPKKDKSDDPPGSHEEDEWREFEEQKKDYSGLRIQNMQLTEAEEAAAMGAVAGEDGDSEEIARRAAPGPWQKASASVAKDCSDDEEVPPAEEQPPIAAAAEPASTLSAYKPPHLRNAGPTTLNTSYNSGLRSGKSRVAPDINNEAYFPTLSAASSTEPAGAWGKKGRREDEMRGFEDVRNSKSHSSRYEGPAGQGGGGQRPVAMENKFAALRGADHNRL